MRVRLKLRKDGNKTKHLGEKEEMFLDYIPFYAFWFLSLVTVLFILKNLTFFKKTLKSISKYNIAY